MLLTDVIYLLLLIFLPLTFFASLFFDCCLRFEAFDLLSTGLQHAQSNSMHMSKLIRLGRFIIIQMNET